MIDENGEQLGVVAYDKAMKMADEKGLDLVLMAGNSKPPVCRLLNYGKFKYDALKKDKEIRKAQKVVETKEVHLSMTIDEHDIAYRVTSAIKFLQNGDKVKIALRMKGREQAYTNKAVDVVKEFVGRLSEYGSMDKEPEKVGRNIFAIVNPIKKN